MSPYRYVPWVLNVRAKPEVTLSRAKDTAPYRAVAVGANEAGPILQQYVPSVTIAAPYFDASVLDPVEKFVDEAPRHPVVKLSPVAVHYVRTALDPTDSRDNNAVFSRRSER